MHRWWSYTLASALFSPINSIALFSLAILRLFSSIAFPSTGKERRSLFVFSFCSELLFSSQLGRALNGLARARRIRVRAIRINFELAVSTFPPLGSERATKRQLSCIS